MQQGAFCAFKRGYILWSSGHLDSIKVNTHHPIYCHVRCKATPSMKAGIYHVYVLLKREGNLASILRATCQCAAGYIMHTSYTIKFCIDNEIMRVTISFQHRVLYHLLSTEICIMHLCLRTTSCPGGTLAFRVCTP